jgi:radical SAM superfamily enzyme YgiQ (UPF0313 family)
MNHRNVIFIAANQPLNNDASVRQNMAVAEKRAERQANRFPNLDLAGMQRALHTNLAQLYLSLDGRYVDLLDLMNFVKNGHRAPELTTGNVSQHYSLANTVTLNGIYMYQYLRENTYHPLIIQNYATTNLKEILLDRPLAICISSNFVLMNDIQAMASTVKQYAPEVPVIAGGMLIKKVLDHGDQLPADALRFLSTFNNKVDVFIVEAHGEQTLLKVLRALQQGSDLSSIPNLALFDETGNIVFTPRLREEMAHDATAIAWNAIPKHYLRGSLPVNSSRGCFYRCKFCTYHWYFPQVHYKSLEVLSYELRLIQELGFVRHVRFTDDNFTANRSRLESILDMMIKEEFDFTWSCFARSGALQPGLVKLMKTAGCEFVDMGLESGSQAILDNMDKRVKREQAFSAIQMLNEEGICSRGSFIVGYPGETRDTFDETVHFINESGLPYYQPYLFYYSKKSPVHEDRAAFGLQGLGLAWKHKTMDAVEASLLMSQMVQRIPKSFTDGVNYIEEIYKLLRGEGYSVDCIHDLFETKRELQLAVDGFKTSSVPAAKGILERIGTLVNGASS